MKNSRVWIYNLLFILVLLAAAWFRFTGINWDQNQHLHPDERFMTMVETSMTPVASLSDYFNTETSTLNPHNIGYSFYVYGDLPILIVRYVASAMTWVSTAAGQYVAEHGTDGVGQLFALISKTTNWAGYDEVTLLGRVLSGLADLGTIFLLYLIAARIYGRKVALLAAAFAAVAVTQIQQSHFFTVDNFANFFIFLATYFAVEIAFTRPKVPVQEIEGLKVEASLPDDDTTASEEELSLPDGDTTASDAVASSDAEQPQSDDMPEEQGNFIVSVLRSVLFWNVIAFGVALGMAVASKITAAPLAILLPVALMTRYFQMKNQLSVVSDQSSVDSEQLPESSNQLSVTSEQLYPTGTPALSATEGMPVESEANTENQTLNTENSALNTDHRTLKTEHWVLNPARLSLELILVLLLIGAFFSAVSFRIFQPYAFSGPGFFNISPNQKWVDNIKEQSNNESGDVDSPPALQWARRSKLFSLQNIVQWGLGWPLGILACLGFLYMGWRILRGEGKHILLWSWTALYFGWQSLQWNPTMRYQLPIYPLLALMAAWLALLAFEHKPQTTDDGMPVHRPRSIVHGLSFAMPLVGLLVLFATAAWAYAFIHIYTVDQSRVQATRWIYANVPGPFNLKISQPDGTIYTQPMPFQSGWIAPPSPYDTQFTPRVAGTLESIVFNRASDTTGSGQQTVSISLSEAPGGVGGNPLAVANLTADFAPKADPRGESYTLTFDPPVTLEKGKDYYLHFTSTDSLLLVGSTPVNETTWDDGLPLRMDGYDAYGGMYQGDHNFEMYWDDNADKLVRFTSNLDSGDYIFISSNRQWGTTTRIPERYPLTISFYRNLIGCPADKDVIWCYNVAQPGTFNGGALGYDLVKVFESYPTIGPWTINDQFADEAFTVYDHPKVLIFQKRPDYDFAKVHAVLDAVDLTNVIHLTPLKAASYRAISLMLPDDKRKADEAGGTWSDLFSYGAIQNNQIVGLLVWYLTIALIGWFTYLFLRLLLPGLADRGYPLARISGLLLLAYFSWLVGSIGGEYSRLTIAIGCALIVLTGLVAAWLKREEVLDEIRTRGKYFLSVEGIFLAFFVIDLLVRFGNPDLWHPGKGGERPMDFAYLNAIIKSSSFPPYDPWFAGGYINYYYWGFVLVGTPIKLLGIVPSLAYNYLLPTLFAMLAIGGFSVAWNIVAATIKTKDAEPENPGAENLEVESSLKDTEPENPGMENPEPEVLARNVEAENPAMENLESEVLVVENAEVPVPETPAPVSRPWFSAHGLRWLAGLSAGAGLVLMGNLGTVRMIYEGLQRMVVSNDVFDASTSIIDHFSWFLQGLPKLFGGQTFAYYPGDWYWIPSRAISTPSGNEITEFPLFTFLYSDLHAHMMALPLTVLVIAWALSVLLARNISRWTWLGTLVFGGLIIGVLRPTNTWDFATYLVLAAVVTGYAVFRYADIGDSVRFGLHPIIQRIFLALFAIGLLVGCSSLFFQPFLNWYALPYSSFKMWEEAKSPIWSYWIHWGVFFFVIISWLAWETRQWLAATPLSSLSKLKPYLAYIYFAIGLVVAAVIALLFGFKVQIAWFTIPLACWALALTLRPALPDGKRFVLFIIATGLAITIFVEVIVLDGDIGRMNTVFKFYLQVWVMFAISSAAAIGWLVADMREWTRGWRNFWYVTGSILLMCALLYMFTGGIEKISDRMTPGRVPPTLDSIDYMNYATYSERDKNMDLSQDFRAIRWLQDNVKGSPVILEGAPAGVQYTWFSRYSIYTGLPTVVGWQWHQEQQRAMLPSGTVAARGVEAQSFYRNTDLDQALDFLKKYNIAYIIVGQLERAAFPEGLAKFEEQDGKRWEAVYRDSETVIYQVLP